MKNEYGLNGHSHTYLDGRRGFVDYSPGKGMELRLHGSQDKATLSYARMARRIAELIADDIYLTPEEKNHYAELEQTYADVGGMPMPTPQIQFPAPAVLELERPAQSPSSAPAPEQAKEPQNFRITDANLGAGGPKAKYALNIEAIRTLKSVEAEGRGATQQEKEILSRYVGWGGISQAFDPMNSAWVNEYEELQTALTKEEYAAARASTLNAHYTRPVVIKAIYEAVENMGFRTGNILDPACGVGNFFGLLPESMAQSKLYGVELDSITGRIATMLYPDADIKVAGFETTDNRDFYDLAVGNVPFGNYKVMDKEYDKLGYSIHDYFFAKTLDQVRPGGIVAFVTSRYTMDKKSSEVRRYIAERAELLGAIRLPNNAFRANAGTDVVSDIIFLQKRERPVVAEPDWITLDTTPDGYAVNSYFIDHPEMVLGTLSSENTQYGREECTVKPIEGADLAAQLNEAVANIHGNFTPYRKANSLTTLDVKQPAPDQIKADPSVRNFSYTVVDSKVYYREGEQMDLQTPSKTAEARIKGMIEVRDCAWELIELQTANCSDEELQAAQGRLNEVYDRYTKEYGLLNDRANRLAFDQDVSYPLLRSLEVLDKNGKLDSKADIFTKRTIRIAEAVEHVDTAIDALTVSVNERAHVDLEYMRQLSGLPEEKLIADLDGVIFPAPGSGEVRHWLTAHEYLAGDIRVKLDEARQAAKTDPIFQVNVKALEEAMPPDLSPGEIDVRLGTTWIPAQYVKQWIFETLDTPLWAQKRMEVIYSESSSVWTIKEKGLGRSSGLNATLTYGTSRIDAYNIIERTLNLKDVRVYDHIETADKTIRQLNTKETVLAQQKQEVLKESFKSWIFRDTERREALVRRYNDLYNSVRPRSYEGTNIRFVGMSPLKELAPHQKNAAARIILGENVLLAHCVGAGKTYEMIAGAMESKRLGLCTKPLFVVPNHLIGQFTNEFLELYPAANILAAREKDFDTDNRKRFCAKIATGEWDGVVIGHSQFERIPISKERQARLIEEQITEIEDGIAQAKAERAENFTIKQMEGMRKRLETKLTKLNAEGKKDQNINFEELGVDRLFVDEAHGYKNLFMATKMTNVAGINTAEAQKSSDMFAKCRYIDEITGGKGIVFATGTPISNSMTELYTMQRYLQYDFLERTGHKNFDAWVSNYGDTVTSLELAPEGTKYQLKTRLAKFMNLPELVTGWKECADIVTADMVKLPVPKAVYHTEVSKPTEWQVEMIRRLGERAGAVRGGLVDASKDNMLKITNDGRSLALDQRLIQPTLPEAEDGKIQRLTQNVYKIWTDTASNLGTQIVFSDLSTPKESWKPPTETHEAGKPYCIYHDLKNKLIGLGVPADEIAIIHEADTNAKKQTLFDQVQNGTVRVLIGSTSKLGAGTNVQQRLAALHHVDVPWRPSDIEQREGRIIRQGNENPEVHIYRYVTEGTFDSYSWQVIENKQRFISQVMTGKAPARSCEDLDGTALSYAEVKALAAGNPLIKERMELETAVSKLKALKRNHEDEIYRLEESVLKTLPKEIASEKQHIENITADIETVAQNTLPENFSMTINGHTFGERKLATERLMDIIADAKVSADEKPCATGMYRGLEFGISYDINRLLTDTPWTMSLTGAGTYRVFLGESAAGNMTRIDNALERLPERLEEHKQRLESNSTQLDAARQQLRKPWPQEKELSEKSARLVEVDTLINRAAKETQTPAIEAELDM